MLRRDSLAGVSVALGRQLEICISIVLEVLVKERSCKNQITARASQNENDAPFQASQWLLCLGALPYVSAAEAGWSKQA